MSNISNKEIPKHIMFDMDFPKNRFSVRYLRAEGWVFMEGNQIISKHKTYEEADNVWSITCQTICIGALS